MKEKLVLNDYEEKILGFRKGKVVTFKFQLIFGVRMSCENFWSQNVM